MIDYKKKYLKYKKKYLMAKKMYGGGRRRTLEGNKRTLESNINNYKVQKDQGLLDPDALQKVEDNISKWEQEIEKINQELDEIDGKNKELTPETPVDESATDNSQGWGIWNAVSAVADKAVSIGTTFATGGLDKVYRFGSKIYAESKYDKNIITLLEKGANLTEEDEKNKIIEKIDKIYIDIKAFYDNYAEKVMKEHLNISIKTFLKKYKKIYKKSHWYEDYITEKLKAADEDMKKMLEIFKQKKTPKDYAEELGIQITDTMKDSPIELVAEHVQKKFLQYMETVSGFEPEKHGINDPTNVEIITNTFSDLGAVEGLEQLALAVDPSDIFGELAEMVVSMAGGGGKKTIKKK